MRALNAPVERLLSQASMVLAVACLVNGAILLAMVALGTSAPTVPQQALGRTVPWFAAVSSFYSQGSYALAPRLMLLDEAFAGIDDTARAHCMGLIREFDLDFVITSEREWGCYAALPGVAICHLQRREGIDAVFVSRWSWDGRAKTRENDPDRRFAPT